MLSLYIFILPLIKESLMREKFFKYLNKKPNLLREKGIKHKTKFYFNSAINHIKEKNNDNAMSVLKVKYKSQYFNTDLLDLMFNEFYDISKDNSILDDVVFVFGDVYTQIEGIANIYVTELFVFVTEYIHLNERYILYIIPHTLVPSIETIFIDTTLYEKLYNSQKQRLETSLDKLEVIKRVDDPFLKEVQSMQGRYESFQIKTQKTT